MTVQAACSDVGICLIPNETLRPLVEEELLVPLLTDVKCPLGVAYLIWADRKLSPIRVTAFREMIFDKLNQPAEFLSMIK